MIAETLPGKAIVVFGVRTIEAVKSPNLVQPSRPAEKNDIPATQQTDNPRYQDIDRTKDTEASQELVSPVMAQRNR